MKKVSVNNRWRQVFQWTILGLIILFILKHIFLNSKVDFEAYCPFGGLMALGSKLWLGSLSCSMSELGIFMGIVLLVGIILFGKLFCGYLCPIGTVIEWFGKPFKKFGVPKDFPKAVDRFLRVGKYLLLFFTAYFTMTSSELWCKKYDPYYAAVSGFDRDVILLWGILAIIAVLALSVIIRFFWCKYVCPLSALSNIFENISLTAPILVLYVLLRYFGVNIHIIWVIGALCAMGALTEIFRFRLYSLTPFKITINKSNCKDCSLCNQYCPQGIPVTSYEGVVTHPDCNLCMDCVVGCKRDGSIALKTVNSPVLPVVVIVLLFGAGMLLAANFEFATLTQRWGTFNESSTVKSFEIRNLRSVKCWGSANSLYNKLRKKNGIIGLDAYAAKHRVVLYYDSSVLDTTGVKKAVFSPRKYKLRRFNESVPESLSVLDVGVFGADDLYDNLDIFWLLKKNPHIWGFGSNFGEPIRIEVAFEEDSLSPSDIVSLIEARGYTKKTRKGDEYVETNFECEKDPVIKEKISIGDFRKRYFAGADFKFNEFESYTPSDLKVFEVGLKNVESIGVRRSLKYLASHISCFDGVVRLKSEYTDREAVKIYFDPSQVDSASIADKIFADSLEIFLSDDRIKKIANRFDLFGPPRVYQEDIAKIQ